MDTNRVVTGDALEELAALPNESVHAVVTDPPYGLAFMGRDWDDFEPREYQEWCEKWATLALDVLKPGGHLLAFSGNRTHHRLFCGVEDAGFEVRDTLTWHYGCLSEDTEVLTPDGWRSHDEIAEGDDVVAFDPDTETFAAEPTARVFRYDHDGEMVRYQSPHTDQLVTPNHRVLHRRRGWKTTYAARSYDSMELPVIHAGRKIRLSGGEDLSNLLLGLGGDECPRGRGKDDLLGGVRERAEGVDATRYVEAPRVDPAGRAGWYGSSQVRKLWESPLDIPKSGENKGPTLLRTGLLRRVEGKRPGQTLAPAGDSPVGGAVAGGHRAASGAHEGREQPGVEGWRDAERPEGELCGRGTGPVPRRVLGDGTPERLRGRTSVEGGEGTRTTALLGGGGTPQEPRPAGQPARKSGTLAEQPDSQTGRRRPRGVAVRTTLARTSRVDYSGTVWCVSVPSSYFVARRNGQAFITGNSGFPKALDVSKAIDKAAGAEREVVETRQYDKAMSGDTYDAGTRSGTMAGTHEISEPATDAAREWDGWKTQLKPATEFIVLARKPFTGTVAENVQQHGTAALNIDSCRIGYDSDGDLEETQAKNPGRDETVTSGVYGEDRPQQSVNGQGRYPANVIFDADAAAALDRDVGELDAGEFKTNHDVGDRGGAEGYGFSGFKSDMDGDLVRSYGDGGGPSRYFYTSKATRAERTENGRIDNAHPTVKPQDLMEWLVRLVTAEGQIVLDPFAGSGTTLKAAKGLGREFIGIEQQERWADVARVRAGLTPHDPANVRDTDADQQGLEAFTDGGPREE